MDILVCQTCGWILKNPVDDCPNCGAGSAFGASSGRTWTSSAWSETQRTRSWQQDSLDYLPLGMSSNDSIAVDMKSEADSPHMMLLNASGDFFERGPDALRNQNQNTGRKIVVPPQTPVYPDEKAGLSQSMQHADEAVAMMTALLEVQKQSRNLLDGQEIEPAGSVRDQVRAKANQPARQSRRSFSGADKSKMTPPQESFETVPSARRSARPKPEKRVEQSSFAPPSQWRAPSLPRFEMPESADNRPIVIVIAASLIVIGTIMLFTAWMGGNSQPAPKIAAPEIAGFYEVRMRIQGEARDRVWRMHLKQNELKLDAAGKNDDGPFQLKGAIVSQNALAFSLVSTSDPAFAQHPTLFQGGFSVDELGRAKMSGQLEAPMRQTTFARVKWLKVPGRWSAKMLVSGAAIGDGN